MKELKKFPGFNKHLRYYLGLNIFIAIIVSCTHVALLLTHTKVSIGILEISSRTSWLIIFIGVCMFIMGIYYLKILQNNKK